MLNGVKNLAFQVKWGFQCWGVVLGMLAVGLPQAAADEIPYVYSVSQALGLGGSAEPPAKDYYLTLGTSQGVRRGSRLRVFRHVATFDLFKDQMDRAVTFPIAVIRVVHVESETSVARLEAFLSPDDHVSISPQAIMVGDLVRLESEQKKTLRENASASVISAPEKSGAVQNSALLINASSLLKAAPAAADSGQKPQAQSELKGVAPTQDGAQALSLGSQQSSPPNSPSTPPLQVEGKTPLAGLNGKS
ncbi:MAG: hypothetical protein ACO3A2_05050 [Bdellovibrionia bacterium]